MKRLIIVFSKFLLVSIIIYCIVVIGLYKTQAGFLNMNIPKKEQRRYGFTARKMEDICKIKAIDIFVLGSSLGFRNYDPKFLRNNGYSSFSLGTSSQKPNMTYVMAKKYLDEVKPKLVIIDVNPYLMLTPDSFETTDVIINSKKNFHDLQLFETAPSLMSLNALIIKYTGFAEKDRKEKLKDSVSDKKDKYLGNGFVKSELIYDEKKKTPNIRIMNFNPIKHQSESFQNLIDLLKQNHIPYLLVLSPLNETYFKKSPVSSKRFRDISRNYFSKYGYYVDSNTLETYRISDFMDFSHLNGNGAQKFTNSLLPIIKKHQK